MADGATDRAAASSGAMGRSTSSSAPMLGMAYERSTQSLQRMSAKMLEERDEHLSSKEKDRLADLGLREGDDVEILKTKLRHKFHTITAGWREGIDTRGSHWIGEADWFKALRTLGFGGNARAAWDRLRRGRKQVNLADLDPDAAGLLSGFFQAYTQEMGPLASLLDGCDARRVAEKGFLRRCDPLKRSSNFRREPVNLSGVFAILQTHPGAVTELDVEWLQKYCTREDKKDSSSSKKSGDSRPTSPSQTNAELRADDARRRALREFKRILSNLAGGIVPAWRRVLDREASGAIALEDLEIIVENMEFKTPAKDLWEEMVGADGDALTIKDWCPQGDAALQEFKQKCFECFGSLKQAFQELLAEKKPLVARAEWSRFCREVKLQSNHNMLLDYLDTRGVGYLSLGEIDMKTAREVCGLKAMSTAREEYAEMDPLPKKAVHLSIAERAKEQCSENLREVEDRRFFREELLVVLQARWESPIRAWGAVMDPASKGKLTKDEFFVGCSVAGFTGSKSSLWKELGLKDSQCVRLRDIAPEALEECTTFKSLCGKQFGRIINAMEAGEGPKAKANGASLDAVAFKDLCVKLGYTSDSKSLMQHFDPDGKGCVNTKNLRFFNEEKKDEKAIQGLVKKHHALQKEKWREKLDGMKLPKSSDVTAKQDECLREARRQRGWKAEPENMRRLFIAELSRKFGSVARAWKRALAVNDLEELNLHAFIDGVKRAGILPARPDGEEEQKYERLFTYLTELSGEDGKKCLRLEHLDPRIYDHIEEFKVKCDQRFGSTSERTGLEIAFEKYDPDATGIISTEKFKALCQEVKITDGVHRMVHYYDPHSDNEIRLEDIDKEAAEMNEKAREVRDKAAHTKLRYDKRMKREHMTTQPRDMGATAKDDGASAKLVKEMQQKCSKAYDTMPRAWRQLFEVDVDETIDFDVFESGLVEAGVEGEASEIWQALGCEMLETLASSTKKKKKANPKNKLSMLQFDPSYEADLREFDTRMRERWGSYYVAFKELVAQGADRLMLDAKGFRLLCHDCQFRLNTTRVFDFFSANQKTVPFKLLNQEAAEALKKEMQRKGGLAKDSEEEEDEEELQPEDAGSLPASPSAPVLPRQDTAGIFRDLLARRFGSSLRAWRALDPEGRAVIKRGEFMRSLSATGYSGSPANLWTALVGEETTFSLKDLDSACFERLASFKRCCSRVYPSLDRIFEDRELAQGSKLSEEEFYKLCKKASVAKPWEPLFEDLAVRDHVGHAEVKFMEEAWTDTKGIASPARQAPRTLSSSQGSFPMRAVGTGHLCSTARPRKVTLSKSSSLPALGKQLRPNWNDRHMILEHMGNKDENMLHLMNHVKIEERERVKLRIAFKMREVPILQWCAEHLPGGEVDFTDDD